MDNLTDKSRHHGGVINLSYSGFIGLNTELPTRTCHIIAASTTNHLNSTFMCIQTTHVILFGCGHTFPIATTGFLQCVNRYCATSATHPLKCEGTECRQTCLQVMEHGGESVTMVANAHCSTCCFVKDLLKRESKQNLTKTD